MSLFISSRVVIIRSFFCSFLFVQRFLVSLSRLSLFIFLRCFSEGGRATRNCLSQRASRYFFLDQIRRYLDGFASRAFYLPPGILNRISESSVLVCGEYCSTCYVATVTRYGWPNGCDYSNSIHLSFSFSSVDSSARSLAIREIVPIHDRHVYFLPFRLSYLSDSPLLVTSMFLSFFLPRFHPLFSSFFYLFESGLCAVSKSLLFGASLVSRRSVCEFFVKMEQRP